MNRLVGKSDKNVIILQIRDSEGMHRLGKLGYMLGPEDNKS